MKNLYRLILILALIGLADSGYLTYEHYTRVIPPCSVGVFFSECGKVLTSPYSTFLGQPLSLWGIFHYSILAAASFGFLLTGKPRTHDLTVGARSDEQDIVVRGKKIWRTILTIFAILGLLTSIYFVYLQVAVLKAFCFYCLISAADSLIIFAIVLFIRCKISPRRRPG